MRKLYETLCRLIDEDPIVIMLYGLEGLVVLTGLGLVALIAKVMLL